ncbi:type II toxin-antitoxin system RelE/ParE family toxin [Saccharopolyspora shandongensis]|uniref:type II toxin-antitoxin system RelE/ParE family toxin n=1 Tax=Saccharopolyspora shandongensis TaxID=418495 RepID=UPI0033D7D4D4
MSWDVELHEEVNTWFFSLVRNDPESADLVEKALDLLAERGPQLGRPLVDKIKGSRQHNLKELRPASAGRSEIRMLFVFDPRRCAIVLVAGDKAGNWRGWYEANIPLAENRFEEHLAELEEG